MTTRLVVHTSLSHPTNVYRASISKATWSSLSSHHLAGTLEKLCERDRLLPKKKKAQESVGIESQPKKNGGDMILSCEQTLISMGLFVQTARGMGFVFKDQVGNWPEIVYALEVQRLVFECYFRKDYCCRKGLLSKIPNDNAFNCRLDFQGMSQSQVSL